MTQRERTLWAILRWLVVVFAAVVAGRVYNSATDGFGIQAGTIAAAATIAAVAWWAMRQIERRVNADANVTPIKTKYWFRFSLKTLLVLMTAIAAWLGFYWKPLQERRAEVAAIERLDGALDVKYYGPKWLRNFVDERCFWEPVGVDFKRPLSVAELESVLPILMSFERLQLLTLPGTTITDETITRISPFADKLTYLNLHDSPISDASIVHLKPFRRLIVVCLPNTRLTSAGLAQLHYALPECSISGFVGNQHVSLGP
jgi:hypothetical protein